jgi:peroxiredoxin
VPSYLENQAGLKSRGIDEVLCYCVNDGAVMDAWAKELKIQGSNLTFLGDPGLEFTTAIDLVKNLCDETEKICFFKAYLYFKSMKKNYIIKSCQKLYELLFLCAFYLTHLKSHTTFISLFLSLPILFFQQINKCSHNHHHHHHHHH